METPPYFYTAAVRDLLVRACSLLARHSQSWEPELSARFYLTVYCLPSPLLDRYTAQVVPEAAFRFHCMMRGEGELFHQLFLLTFSLEYWEIVSLTEANLTQFDRILTRIEEITEGGSLFQQPPPPESPPEENQG